MQTWIMHLTGAAVLGMLAIAITPEGRVKKAVKLICGFAVILSIISGVTDFDFRFYSKSMADYRAEAEKLVADSQREQSALERKYIEDECEAYILDKAIELGLSCESASVTVKWSEEGYWYPVAVELNAEFEHRLASCIEAELGIPMDNQTWSETDEDG